MCASVRGSSSAATAWRRAASARLPAASRAAVPSARTRAAASTAKPPAAQLPSRSAFSAHSARPSGTSSTPTVSPGATRLDRLSTTYVRSGASAANTRSASGSARKDHTRSSTTGIRNRAATSASSARRSGGVVRPVGLCRVGWKESASGRSAARAAGTIPCSSSGSGTRTRPSRSAIPLSSGYVSASTPILPPRGTAHVNAAASACRPFPANSTRSGSPTAPKSRAAASRAARVPRGETGAVARA
ncbi:hypothetical protein GA0115246_106141, partial [Streptomyces sp. SolWspMP-sol7th]